MAVRGQKIVNPSAEAAPWGAAFSRMIRWQDGRPYRVSWNNVPYRPGRTVFLLNGKCGNSSVKTALLIAQGLPADRPHLASEVWSPGRAAGSGFRAIGVVRNPYARAVSIWHSKILRGDRSRLFRKASFVKGMDFVDFLRVAEGMHDNADVHVRAQWYAMVHRGRFLPERVVRLEEPEGWEAVRALLPELPALPHANARGAPPWERLVEGEAGDIIRRRWALDFELFGYER